MTYVPPPSGGSWSRMWTYLCPWIPAHHRSCHMGPHLTGPISGVNLCQGHRHMCTYHPACTYLNTHNPTLQIPTQTRKWTQYRHRPSRGTHLHTITHTTLPFPLHTHTQRHTHNCETHVSPGACSYNKAALAHSPTHM